MRLLWFFMFLFVCCQATIPSICLDPDKSIYAKLKDKYTFVNGTCNRVYFFEFVQSPTYFDTKQECVDRCINYMLN